MRKFYIAMIPISLFFFCVFAVAKNVRFKPWVKTGQEQEYREWKHVLEVAEATETAAEPPRLKCEIQEFDFGTLSPFTQGAYAFVVENIGTKPLALKGAVPSCSCLEADFTAAIVEPGQRREITVTWNSDKAGDFAQYVTLHTNCPDSKELQLWVRGKVATILGASHTSLGSADMVPGEGVTQEFQLFSDVWQSLSIDRIVTSDEVTCELIQQSPAGEPAPKAHFRMRIAPRATSGTLQGFVRIYVRPPEAVLDSNGQRTRETTLVGLGSLLQSDGTVLMDLPVTSTVRRRFALYSPIITDPEKNLIDLGKLTTKTSKGKKWVIIARVRGGVEPTEVRASLTGIPNVAASVEKVEVKATNDFTGSTYRIKLEVMESLQPAAYDFLRQGKLRIETPGLPGEELLEFFVELDIMPDD